MSELAPLHRGSDHAKEVIMSLMVDDGVADRGHRLNIMEENFNLVGIAVGPHKELGTVIVMVFVHDLKSSSTGATSSSTTTKARTKKVKKVTHTEMRTSTEARTSSHSNSQQHQVMRREEEFRRDEMMMSRTTEETMRGSQHVEVHGSSGEQSTNNKTCRRAGAMKVIRPMFKGLAHAVVAVGLRNRL